MKLQILILVLMFSVLGAKAQRLNDKGLYVDNEGELFSGVISNIENGNKKQISVKNGLAEGEAQYYYASGKLMEKGSFLAGQKEDKWLRYNEAGNITAVAFYHLGKKTGTWLVYDDNGKKRFEMSYADGQKSGVWTSWDESGLVVDTKDYSKVQ